jgi:hypothetical protein
VSEVVLKGCLIRAENVPKAEEPEYLEQHVGGPTEGQIQPVSEEVMLISAEHRIAFNPGTVERMDRIVSHPKFIQKVTGAIPLVKLAAGR